MSAEGTTDRGMRVKGRRILSAAIAICCLGMLAAGSAQATEVKISKEEIKSLFKKFVDCNVAKAQYCTRAETLSGEFKLGSKTAPIVNPLVLQGGLESIYFEQTLLPPLYGAEEVSKTSQPLPGGLTGIEGIGGEVSATAELVKGGVVKLIPTALVSNGPAVVLPIKIHLQNEALGPECYIGSDSEPVVLKLSDSASEPPAGTEPIKGKEGKVIEFDKGRIYEFHENTLVDNGFSVPAATNCGPTPLLDPIVTAVVNLDAGLPSAAGKNVAILNGNVMNAKAEWVAKADRKEIKAKEKAAKPTK